MPTRRHVLLGGAGAAVTTLGVGGCQRGGGIGIRTEEGSLTSTHMPGASPAWRIVTPTDAPARGLVIALHGFGTDAPGMMDGLALADHVARTRLAVAAVSGGNSYWHRRRAGLDPGAMVVDDFVPLARTKARIAATAPIAFLGFSMGGYGALLLASQLGAAAVFGVVAESAALWTEPGLSAAGAFDDREDFLAHDVFARTEVLSRIPIRLDCGSADPFLAANRAFAGKLPHAVFTVDPGGHTTGFWHDHAGRQMDWLADHAPST